MSKKKKEPEYEEELNKDYTRIPNSNLFRVAKHLLPKGVTYRCVVGKPVRKKENKSPYLNKFAHLVDPDSHRGDNQRWI